MIFRIFSQGNTPELCCRLSAGWCNSQSNLNARAFFAKIVTVRSWRDLRSRCGNGRPIWKAKRVERGRTRVVIQF
jgi:hypothetical protein